MYKKENSTQELWDHLKKELEDSIDETYTEYGHKQVIIITNLCQLYISGEQTSILFGQKIFTLRDTKGDRSIVQKSITPKVH